MRNHVRKSLFVPVVALLVLSSAMTALAAPNGGIRVQPGIYDPDGTGIVVADWRQGGGSGYGVSLFLAKNGATETNAAAGAEIPGVDGITLTELGFDYRNDGYCGAGAPRFNVFTDDGALNHFFGCSYGVHTNLGNGWTRVRYTAADGLPPVSSSVSSIEIVLDEEGAVYIDNIDVNGAI